VTCSHRVDDKIDHGIPASKFLSLQDNSPSCLVLLSLEMVGKYHPQTNTFPMSISQNRYEPKAQHQILLLRITEQGKTLSYPSASGTSRSHLRDGLCLLGPPSTDPNILEFTNSFFVSYLEIPHFRSNKRMSTVTPSPLKQFLNQRCSYI